MHFKGSCRFRAEISESHSSFFSPGCARTSKKHLTTRFADLNLTPCTALALALHKTQNAESTYTRAFIYLRLWSVRMINNQQTALINLLQSAKSCLPSDFLYLQVGVEQKVLWQSAGVLRKYQ